MRVANKIGDNGLSLEDAPELTAANLQLTDVWLVQPWEPLPSDSSRLFRTGTLAEFLSSHKVRVRWFVAQFDHYTKRLRPGSFENLVENRSLGLVPLRGPVYAAHFSISRFIHQHIVAFDFVFKCFGAARLAPPQVIVASYPAPELCVAAAAIAKVFDLPLVLDIRDPWPELFHNRGGGVLRRFLFRVLYNYYNLLLKIAVNSADGVIGIGFRMLSVATTRLGRSSTPLTTVIPIGYPSVAKKESRARGAVLQMVFVGTFADNLAGELLIDALRLLPEEYRRLVNVKMIGDGPVRCDLENLARGIECIEFTGWLSRGQLEDSLNRADIGLALYKGPLAEYGVPNKIFEYMAYGLYVLSNLSEEVTNLVESEGIGLTVSRDDPSSLADAIKWLLKNRSMVEMGCKRAIELHRNNYSTEIVNNRYARFLEQVVRHCN